MTGAWPGSIALGASLLLAAWLYLKPPSGPSASAPIVPYVRAFPAGDPLSWMDEYWSERRAKAIAKKQGWADWLGDKGWERVDPDQPLHNTWPHLQAEGNTSDI